MDGSASLRVAEEGPSAGAPVTQVVFTVYAPIGSWGTESLNSANAAYKPTGLDPTRSALGGMVAAALGMPRQHLGFVLDRLRFAYRIDRRPSPQPKTDYHTITKGAPPEGVETWGRFEEWREGQYERDRKGGVVGTRVQNGSIISHREFFEDGLWTIAVHSTDHEGLPPDAIADALNAPCWSLYVGRRCFPIGLPPDAAVITATSPQGALAAYGTVRSRHPDLGGWLPKDWPKTTKDACEMHFDLDYPGCPEVAHRTVERLDVLRVVPMEAGNAERGRALGARRFSPRKEGQAFDLWT